MTAIDLSPEEIAILRSALDSAEYWEHKDVLPHNSGYILDPAFMVEAPEMDEEQREAWDAVLALRALDDRLAALEKEEVTSNG